jgi:2-iminobutanoate/2-iminopropanoate deaminase
MNSISKAYKQHPDNDRRAAIEGGSNMKEIIATDKAPAAIGPYSQAVKVGNLIFTSGMIPIDPATNTLVTGDIKVQATQAISNLKALIEASGSSLDKVVKTVVFIKNMDDFAAVNEIYAQFFTDSYPARSCVEVARLPKDVLIEIEAVALAE